MGEEPVVELSKANARTGTTVTLNVYGRQLEVRIPAGVNDNALLRLPGVGPSGETYVRVRIKSSAHWYLIGVFSLVVLLIVVLVLTERPASSPVIAASSSSETTTTTTVTTTETSAVLPGPLDNVNVSQCLKNTGTETNPAMLPSPCDPGTFRVLDRHYGTVDDNVCANVVQHTHAYTVEKYVVTYRGGREVSRELTVRDSYVFCLQVL